MVLLSPTTARRSAAGTGAAVVILFFLSVLRPSTASAYRRQSSQSSTKYGSKWTLVAPSPTSLPGGNPPTSFNRSANSISPVGVSDKIMDDMTRLDARRLHTNKFYSNFVIDGPSRAAWTLPYIVTVNDEYPYGLYVSYPNMFEGQREDDGRLKWYATATNKDLIVSAQELETSQEVSLVDFDDEGLSATVEFTSEDEPGGSMITYLVRGMAYATMKYTNYTPQVSSVHAMLKVNGKGANEGNHTSPNGRFMLELNNGNQWIIYSSVPDLELFYVHTQPNEPNKLQANVAMTGILRAALVPYDKDNANYDYAVESLDSFSGSYPVGADVKAWINATNERDATYSIAWDTAGDESVGLLHYALPHHQDILSSVNMTGLFLSSPTKGNMQLVSGTTWTLPENDLPEFEWAPDVSAATSPTEIDWIEHHLELELSVPLDNADGISVYFGGKNLMAYAQLCLVAGEIGRDDLVEYCVDEVESAFECYMDGTNGNPLVYDTIWGGLIGSLGLEPGSEGADFNAAFYNDHHFHYSYLLHAAAVLAHLRPSWATAEHKNWVEALIRDVNNPNKDDPYFPQFRSFDWFCGHSWARGLLFSYDGKDQESTSEDVNFFYAMTMWAIATGNTNLAGLGRLQTGVVTRSIQDYFLLKDSNTNHPADFVRNKVTGIFFESKVDYTTWFGDNVEFIHGIQNIPVTAITEYVRDPEFVREEWDQRLASAVESASGVWSTVLYMSYATIQKHLAFNYMLTTGVDDGLLRSWALYWAATRPDCALYCNHDEVAIEEVPRPTPAPVVPSGAYGGTTPVIPGTIEAEEYDYGGEGVAFSDADPGNNGGVFRFDGVDVKSNDVGGYYVGWTEGGEFARYSVSLQEDVEAFDFDFNVAAPSGQSGSFRIVTGGTGCSDYTVDLSGLVSVTSTGGWGTFALVSESGGGSGGMSAGDGFVWWCIISPGFNLDYFTMIDAAA